jgi:large subunit ribosomal protein L21
MFAVVRTGGKQYRVGAQDVIEVEKLPGVPGDSVALEALLVGEGADLKAGAGQTVAAEIVAQIRGDKVRIFKKVRRHTYRRSAGHRQWLTVLKITGLGDAPQESAA